VKKQKLRVGVLLPAAGEGRRMGMNVPKQYLHLHGKPLLVHTVLHFERCEEIDDIVIIVSKGFENRVRRYVKKYSLKKVRSVVTGGERRQDSVANGWQDLKKYFPEIILVHDAVRPLITEKLIQAVIFSAKKFGAAVPVIQENNTMCVMGKGNVVSGYLSREKMRIIQTPQGFKKEIFVKSLQNAIAKKTAATDESSLVFQAGYPVKAVEGLRLNIKLTTKEDLLIIKNILRTQ